MKSAPNLLLTCAMLLLTGCGSEAPNQAEGDDEHRAHGAAPASPTISKQLEEALGLTTEVAVIQPYTITEPIQAVAEAMPTSERLVSLPLGGRVEEVYAVPGQRLKPGGALLTLVRAPIPRIDLALTGELLKPASEEFHEKLQELRRVRSQRVLVATELERLKKLNTAIKSALPVVPHQRLLDLSYQITGFNDSEAAVLDRLRRHGWSTKDADQWLQGAPTPHMVDRWKYALQANGLWNTSCDAVLALLPEATQAQPWTIATLGELAGLGLMDKLPDWVARNTAAADHWLAVGSLLQQGYTRDAIALMLRDGCFDSRSTLTAPPGAATWEITDVSVRAGQQLGADTVVARLRDPNRLWLEARPTARERIALAQILQSGAPISARPLSAGTGPELSKLRVQSLYLDSTEGDIVARVIIPTAQAQGLPIQPGTRYTLEIPVRELAKAWVLPAEALVSLGQEQTVLVRNGDTFESRPVTLLHRTPHQAVLALSSDLFPGDAVVTKGAFALAMALNTAGGTPVDPHAGHSH